MTRAEIQSAVLGALGEVAPEAALGVDIPEADYPKLSTLDGCVAYLLAAAPQHRT